MKRFPSDFMFQLTSDEWAILKSQFVISSWGGTRVAVRQMLANPPIDRLGNIEKEVKELKEYIEEVFADYNDINDDTRMQLELINQTLAELQAQKRMENKPRNPIGFIKPENK